MSGNHSPEITKGAIAWMAGHSVAANLIMLTCLIGGFIFLQNIKQELFPVFEVDTVEVAVTYPGASPEEVESGIYSGCGRGGQRPGRPGRCDGDRLPRSGRR
ncbi:MAG: hypothetical protein MUO63_20575 [Desulfobulbaceae bacterium]|nr:hypothetical protein [Desulfobulbaceae bacterium]